MKALCPRADNQLKGRLAIWPACLFDVLGHIFSASPLVHLDEDPHEASWFCDKGTQDGSKWSYPRPKGKTVPTSGAVSPFVFIVTELKAILLP